MCCGRFAGRPTVGRHPRVQARADAAVQRAVPASAVSTPTAAPQHHPAVARGAPRAPRAPAPEGAPPWPGPRQARHLQHGLRRRRYHPEGALHLQGESEYRQSSLSS